MKKLSKYDHTDYWERVKNICKTKKISIVDIADNLNISKHTLYSYIQRNNLPTYEIAIGLSEILNVSCEFLYSGENTILENRIQELETENTKLKERLESIHNIAIQLSK